jgi:hypothetical protein
MKVIISRFYGISYTKGTLQVFEGNELLYTCKTIELRWLDNQHDISCIPEGSYHVEKFDSSTKGKCFWIKNVPGRSGILIHKGNFVSGQQIDSKGCILVGKYFSDINYDGFIDIADSTKALDQLSLLLPDSFRLHII